MNHLEVMERRNKSLPTDLYGYKTGGMAPYGLDVLIPDKLDFDESRMSMTLPFADGNRRDGVGDLLEVSGIRTERHQKNAIVLFDHGKKLDLPIAMAWEWDDKAGKYDTSRYTVKIDPVAKTASLDAYFYQGKGIIPGEEGVDRSRVSDHGLLCEQYYDLAVKGLLRGGSIGYQVVKALQLQPDYEQGLPQGLHLLSTTMLEGSLVVLPANMDTVQKMLSMPTCCGKPLSPYLIKSLQHYAPPRKAQMGYEGKARAPGERFRTSSSVYEVIEPSAQQKEDEPYLRGSESGYTDPTTDIVARRIYPSEAEGQERTEHRFPRDPEGHASGVGGQRFHDAPLRPRKPRFPPEDEGQSSLKSEKKYITHDNGEYVVHSHTGRVFGRYKTKKEAENRLAQMEAHKAIPHPEDPNRAIPEVGDVVRPRKMGTRATRSDYSTVVAEDPTSHRRRYTLSPHSGGSTTQVSGEDVTVSSPPDPAEERRVFGEIEKTEREGYRPKKKGIKGPSAHVGGNRLNRNNSVPGPGGYVPPNWKPGVGAMPHKSSGAIHSIKALSLRAKYGTSQKSIQAQEILSQIETKSLKDLRLKHRQVKGTRRKVKNTQHGSSILYVSGKDLEKVRNLAKDKGVTCKLLGTHHTGAEKVHLFGDDSIIDEISMQYGRPLKMFKGRGIKAIIVSNTKDGEGLRRIKAHRPGERFRIQPSEHNPDPDVYEVIEPSAAQKESGELEGRVLSRRVTGRHAGTPFRFSRDPVTGHATPRRDLGQVGELEDLPPTPKKPKFPPEEGEKAHRPGDKFKLGESVYEVTSEGTNHKVPARTVSGPAHNKSPGKRVFPRCPDTGHVSTGSETAQFEDVPKRGIKARHPGERFGVVEQSGDPGRDVYEVIEPTADEKRRGSWTPPQSLSGTEVPIREDYVPARLVGGRHYREDEPVRTSFWRDPETGHAVQRHDPLEDIPTPKKPKFPPEEEGQSSLKGKKVKARYAGERFRFNTEPEGDPKTDVFEVIEPTAEEKETGYVSPEHIPARSVSGRSHERNPQRYQFRRDPHTGHATTNEEARAAGVEFTDVPTPPRKPRFPPEENKKIKALRKKYGKKRQVKAVRHPEDSNRWVQNSS